MTVLPNQILTIDDGILAWRGRLCFRCYNPGKLRKNIIIRMVCDSVTVCICNVEIYCKQYRSLENNVQGLLQPFAGVGHIVVAITSCSVGFNPQTLKNTKCSKISLLVKVRHSLFLNIRTKACISCLEKSSKWI
jgi:hypothetical protein